MIYANVIGVYLCTCCCKSIERSLNVFSFHLVFRRDEALKIKELTMLAVSFLGKKFGCDAQIEVSINEQKELYGISGQIGDLNFDCQDRVQFYCRIDRDF